MDLIITMHELIEEPHWRAVDLGKPIPDSPHAVSVCLPTWQDNIGYEENDPRVMSRLSTGYPRFVYNSLCQRLFARAKEQFAEAGQACLVFPNGRTAERCAQYLHDATNETIRIESLATHDAHTMIFQEQYADVAKSYWQHTGEGISSRHAKACLTNSDAIDATNAKAAIKSRLAKSMDVDAKNVFLYPNGMNAIFTLHRALQSLFPKRKSAQFGFPYVDTLKIQQKLSPGVYFYPQGGREEIRQLAGVVKRERLSAVYTEFPSNPLLISPDLAALSELSRRHDFPLILDDTIATSVNVDLMEVADVVCTSLTKFFSGVGDVTGGACVLNESSPFYAELFRWLTADFEDLMWCENAITLNNNSKEFGFRVARINNTAEKLADFLNEHPKIERVYYPKFQTPEQYNAFRKPQGGYGGVMSWTFKDEIDNAPRFYDALRVCKGPNLGTNYSLACPYTILAHYNEISFARSCGVSPFLIRFSVGLEEASDLIGRIEEALNIL